MGIIRTVPRVLLACSPHDVAGKLENGPAHTDTEGVNQPSGPRDDAALPRLDAVALYRLLAAASPDGIIATDSRRTILTANPALERMFGYAEGTMLGMPLELLMPLRLRHHHSAGMARYLDTGVRRLDWSGTRTLGVRADGSEFPLLVAFGEGEIDGRHLFLGFLSDVSREVAAEQQLRQKQKMEAVGQLAGGVAHDFNNLLTVILSHAQFLLDESGSTHDSREDATAIHEAALRAAALTRQLLAFSRRQVLLPAAIQLHDVVGKLEPMLRRLIGEHIRFATHSFTDRDIVVADRGQLEQVIINLVLNARDAMPRGGTLTVDVADAKAADEVVLCVCDTGTGMSEEVMSRAFEPFFTTKASGEGTGLGLATAFGIVAQSGGRIEIASEEGAGTTVTVSLPRAEVSAKRSSGERVVVAAEGKAGAVILLAEDEDDVRRVAARMLRTAGYVVLEAHNGAHALLVATEHAGPIALLLTDVVMPEVSGVELATWFHATFPQGEVIYMSGYTDDDLFRQGLTRERIRFVNKPFTRVRLLEEVAAALSVT